MESEYELINNEDQNRYEFHIDGYVPRVEYILTKDHKIYLTHTEVPRELEGKGIASALVKQVLSEVEKSGRELVPLCPYVAQYIKRHPEWTKLVAKEFGLS
ncbi:MAG: GNAT family N-acetyltransferase [Bacteroidota bacterium]